ncbi:hypothetical protein R3P38DRAFT_3198860 [Favolaschia claudopus]|uniref:Uncharacterized protein n=1 Tax=Favolaschia claudopus TaxID=2862362 RepID=A0AAW0B0G1_9AGAR
MTFSVCWMDNPLIPSSSSAFDLSTQFSLDAGRPEDLPFDTRAYYPCYPVDAEGVYHSPRLAYQKQVAAKKQDPRYQYSGLGLGLGLSGVTKYCGVMQYRYRLSDSPVFGDPTTPVPDRFGYFPSLAKEAEPVEEVVPEAPPAQISFWDALMAFVDSAYSLSPDSPSPEDVFVDAPVAVTPSSLPVEDFVHPVVQPLASPSPFIAYSPVPALASPPKCPSPAHSPAPALAPPSKIASPSIPLQISQTVSQSLSLSLSEATTPIIDILSPILDDTPTDALPSILATTKIPGTSLRLTFSLPGKPTPSHRPTWFSYEADRAAEYARRFNIGLNITRLDRLRGKLVIAEARSAEAQLRREAEEDKEERARKEFLSRPVNPMLQLSLKPRFSLKGLSFDMVVRQQRRRDNGPEARMDRNGYLIRREEYLAFREKLEEKERREARAEAGLAEDSEDECVLSD